MLLQTRSQPPLNSQMRTLWDWDFRKMFDAMQKAANPDRTALDDDDDAIDRATNLFDRLLLPDRLPYAVDSQKTVWYQAGPTKPWFIDAAADEAKGSLWLSRGESSSSFAERMFHEARGLPKDLERNVSLTAAKAAGFNYYDHDEHQHGRLVFFSPGKIVLDRRLLRSHCGIPYIIYPGSNLPSVGTGNSLNRCRINGQRLPLLFYLSQRLGCWTRFNGSVTRFELLQQLRIGRRLKRLRPTHQGENGQRYRIAVLLGQVYFLDDAGHYHSWNEETRTWSNSEASFDVAQARRIDEITAPQFPAQMMDLIEEDNEFGQHAWLFSEPDKPSDEANSVTRHRGHFFRHYRILKADNGHWQWSYDLPASWARGQAGPMWKPGGTSLKSLLRALAEQDERRANQATPMDRLGELRPYEIYQDARGSLFYAHDQDEIGLWDETRHCWINTELPLARFQEFMLTQYEQRRREAGRSQPRGGDIPAQPTTPPSDPEDGMASTAPSPSRIRMTSSPEPAAAPSTAQPTRSEADIAADQPTSAPQPTSAARLAKPAITPTEPATSPAEETPPSSRGNGAFDPSQFTRLDISEFSKQ